MEKLVIFQPCDGDFFQHGFERINILVYLSHENNSNNSNNSNNFKQLTGSLPTAPYIANSFQNWRRKYKNLLNNLPAFNFQRGFVDAQVTHISIKDFSSDTAVLRDYLNHWLDSEIFTGLTQLAQAMVRYAHRAHKKLHRRHHNIWAF